jgi:hypothetical protein
MIRNGQCADPGPGDAHCTEDRIHRFSCYDAGADVSFNDRHDFTHACTDRACPTPNFVNEGD